MLSRLHLSVILFLAVIVWALSLFLFGEDIAPEFFRPFSIVLAVLVVALMGFEWWLWRLPFLYPWFVKMPMLSGTWKTELRPESSSDSIEAYMVIRQRFSSLSMRLLTKESSSEVLLADIMQAPDGTYRIASVYRNEPRLAVREESPIHNGACLLSGDGRLPDTLRGHYWTDRSSSGEMILSHRQKKALETFDAAQSAVGEPVSLT